MWVRGEEEDGREKARKRREERFEQKREGGGIFFWCDYSGQRHQGGPTGLNYEVCFPDQPSRVVVPLHSAYFISLLLCSLPWALHIKGHGKILEFF